MTKSLWSSPNQFGQTKTILDRQKLFLSHRRTRHKKGTFKLGSSLVKAIIIYDIGSFHQNEILHYDQNAQGIAEKTRLKILLFF